VYPNGSGASQGTHLSVFLEVSLNNPLQDGSPEHICNTCKFLYQSAACSWRVLQCFKSLLFQNTQLTGRSSSNHDVLHQMVEGGNEPGTYEYGIELIHHTCPNQCVIRKFSSDFEASVWMLLVLLHFCGILIDAYIDDDQSC